MKRTFILFIFILSTLLVACGSDEEIQEEDPMRYESVYLEEHRENADDYEDLYGEELYIENELLEQLYDDILKTASYEEKLINYKVSEYAYGSFKDNYNIVSHTMESEEKLDSNIFNPVSGNKIKETIIRGDTIFQREEETGIVDETSFYKDQYDPNYFYILGLDSDFDKNFSRMMYFLLDSEVTKSSTEPNSAVYEITVKNLDRFKEYLLTDVNDDFVQHFSTVPINGLQGIDLTYNSKVDGGRLTMKIFLDSGEYELVKEMTRGEDLHFRNMENMEPETIDLKR